MGERLWAGMPSRYVTSQLGQLSLASLWGRLIEYQLRLGSGWQLTLCDPMWHTLHLATRQTQIAKVLGSFGQLLCLLHTHPFNGALSGTTQVSRYQKGKTNLDFTETRDSEWQWHQLGHMQVCTSLQTDNTPATHHSVFTGRMPFLPPNQHRQSTEGKSLCLLVIKHLCSGCFAPYRLLRLGQLSLLPAALVIISFISFISGTWPIYT